MKPVRWLSMVEKYGDTLKRVSIFWNELGFEPWSWNGLEGVYRHMIFRKGGLMGQVAQYCADDYIVWRHMGESDQSRILQEWKPKEDVMSHRFLLVEEGISFPFKSRGFLFGFRGWVEVQRFRPGDQPHRKFKDLAYILEKALEYGRRFDGSPEGGEVAGDKDL